MKPVKLIVTNKAKLHWKYGKNFSKINLLLKQMQVADKRRGLDTEVAFVDDAASLTGTLSVASIGSTRSLKDTILSVLGMQGNNDADSLKSSNMTRFPRKLWLLELHLENKLEKLLLSLETVLDLL